jgi:hypothetical protein
MARILQFRTATPAIYIDGTDESWWVNVRPCPVGMPTLRSLMSKAQATEHARHLQCEYGWRIEVAPESEMGGAA